MIRWRIDETKLEITDESQDGRIIARFRRITRIDRQKQEFVGVLVGGREELTTERRVDGAQVHALELIGV